MPPQEEKHSGEAADRIARLLLEENREVLQAAKEALKRRLMRAAMQMAMAELGDPERMAEQVYESLGTDNPAVAQASKLLQERLLDDVAERSLEPFTDPADAASRAMNRVDRDDARLRSSESAMKDLLLKQVLADALQELDEEIGLDDEADAAADTGSPGSLPMHEPTARPSDTPAPTLAVPEPPLARVEPPALADAPLDERRTWVNRVSYADAAIAQLREPEDQRERDYFYTYGVVREQIPSTVLSGTGIQPERPPYLVPCGTVLAVVSKLEGLPFHSAERDTLLREPSRKREFKREHIRVLEAISAAGHTVVPRPYGTIAASEDKIIRTITAQSASFESALERLSGRREWSVQLFKMQPVPVEAPRATAGLYASGDSYARIYDAGLEAGPQGEDDGEESGLVAVIKRSIYNALLAVAADATMNATYGARTEKGLMVLNAAYLVDVEHEETFLETASRLNDRQKSLGFALVCSGPRVPLSFWQ